LQFETDNMNKWMLEAKLEPNNKTSELVFKYYYTYGQMNAWMLEAKLEPKKWANRIETVLNLVPQTYMNF